MSTLASLLLEPINIKPLLNTSFHHFTNKTFFFSNTFHTEERNNSDDSETPNSVMMMKRAREETEFTNSLTMANCLMLLSRGGLTEFNSVPDSPSRVFECKTCNRQFPSFQALGGHRASHKKPRLASGAADGTNNLELELRSSSATTTTTTTAITKPKTHECSICGVEFAIGQALGGHMRRHRTASSDNHNHSPPRPVVAPAAAPIVKRTNSSRRIMGLDLNLTPLENDLEFMIGKLASVRG